MDPISFFKRQPYVKESSLPIQQDAIVALFHRIVANWLGGELKVSKNTLTVSLPQSTLDKLQKMSCQQLVETAHSFANLRIYHKFLFDGIADNLILKSSELKSKEIVKIVSAFAALNIHDVLLFRSIGQEALKKDRVFTPQESKEILSAFKALGIYDLQLFRSLDAE